MLVGRRSFSGGCLFLGLLLLLARLEEVASLWRLVGVGSVWSGDVWLRKERSLVLGGVVLDSDALPVDLMLGHLSLYTFKVTARGYIEGKSEEIDSIVVRRVLASILLAASTHCAGILNRRRVERGGIAIGGIVDLRGGESIGYCYPEDKKERIAKQLNEWEKRWWWRLTDVRKGSWGGEKRSEERKREGGWKSERKEKVRRGKKSEMKVKCESLGMKRVTGRNLLCCGSDFVCQLASPFRLCPRSCHDCHHQPRLFNW